MNEFGDEIVFEKLSDIVEQEYKSLDLASGLSEETKFKIIYKIVEKLNANQTILAETKTHIHTKVYLMMILLR